jgi:hypothetical protein
LFTPPPFLLSQDAKLRVQGKTLDIVNKSEKQNQSTFGRQSESNKQTKKINFNKLKKSNDHIFAPQSRSPGR